MRFDFDDHCFRDRAEHRVGFDWIGCMFVFADHRCDACDAVSLPAIFKDPYQVSRCHLWCFGLALWLQ